MNTTNTTNTAAVSGAKLLQTAADAIDGMLHICCNGIDISPINAAWEHGEKVLVELRAALAAPAQPVAPAQAGEYPKLPYPGGNIEQGGGWVAPTPFFTADQMRAFADATCAARGASQAATVDADTGRLNWLEQHSDGYYNLDRISSVVGSGFFTGPLNLQQKEHDTLREAIDAARAAQGVK